MNKQVIFQAHISHWSTILLISEMALDQKVSRLLKPTPRLATYKTFFFLNFRSVDKLIQYKFTCKRYTNNSINQRQQQRFITCINKLININYRETNQYDTIKRILFLLILSHYLHCPFEYN